MLLNVKKIKKPLMGQQVEGPQLGTQPQNAKLASISLQHFQMR